MKAIEKLKAKLTTINTRWSAEAAENDKATEEAQTRLKIANEALEEAETPEDYAHATKQIQTAKNELDFYKHKAARFNHTISEEDYKNYINDIEVEAHKIISDYSEKIEEDLNDLYNMLTRYETEAKEINNLIALLNKMSGKAPDLRVFNPIETIQKDKGDLYKRFCFIYANEKTKKEVYKQLNIK